MFDSDGIAWAEEQAAARSSSLEELGAVTLSREHTNVVDTRNLLNLVKLQDITLLQLSGDVRIAFTKEAMTLEEDDEDDWY